MDSTGRTYCCFVVKVTCIAIMQHRQCLLGLPIWHVLQKIIAVQPSMAKYEWTTCMYQIKVDYTVHVIMLSCFVTFVCFFFILRNFEPNRGLHTDFKGFSWLMKEFKQHVCIHGRLFQTWEAVWMKLLSSWWVFAETTWWRVDVQALLLWCPSSLNWVICLARLLHSEETSHQQSPDLPGCNYFQKVGILSRCCIVCSEVPHSQAIYAASA